MNQTLAQDIIVDGETIFTDGTKITKEVYEKLKELLENGYGREEVFVRKLGESSDTTISKIKFIDLISSFSSDGKEERVEIVHN